MPRKESKGLKSRAPAEHEEEDFRGPGLPKVVTAEISSPRRKLEEKWHLLFFTLLCGDQESYLSSCKNKGSSSKPLE